MADSPIPQKMVRRIRVFVASPGDVGEERNRTRAVIERVNERHALGEGILLDPWLWEIDAVPGVGRVQEQINPDLDSAAVVILILWNRLGTPTAEADSGTVEEFERAVERHKNTGWPRILVYYCHRNSVLNSEDDLQQRARVLRFQKNHEADVLAGSFITPEEFEEKLETHLDAVVDQIAAIPVKGRGYRKILYVKVTYLGSKGQAAGPFYKREIDRLKELEEEDHIVPVYDEAVYYTLEMFAEQKNPGPRTDRTVGVLDPRMVVPLKNPLVFSDHDAGLIKETVQMEVNEECDTLLTISHFENGLQKKDSDFCSRVPEDAEYIRIIVDMSSLPPANRLLRPVAACLITATGHQDVKIVPFGASMYMVSCENAKKGDLLKMSFSRDLTAPAAKA